MIHESAVRGSQILNPELSPLKSQTRMLGRNIGIVEAESALL
jgi:hypothetical protein